MASKDVMFKPLIQGLIMFTMFFSGGMIPAYLNVRSLGLYNSLWALILPGALSVYNPSSVRLQSNPFRSPLRNLHTSTVQMM